MVVEEHRQTRKIPGESVSVDHSRVIAR
jgi:hypothetical protein